MAEADAANSVTAGALLRRARLAQGLQIDALATAIKIVPDKLELLEADRFSELPDLAFTRALALRVCRALAIDAAPVMALLPQTPVQQRLERVSRGLNAPFHEQAGSHDTGRWLLMSRPALWAPLLLLVAAAVIYLLPARVGLVDSGTPPQPAASAAAAGLPDDVVPTGQAGPPSVAFPEPVVQPDAVAETVHPAADSVDPGAAPADPVPAVAVLQLRARAQSWVQVLDGRGQALLSRVLQPGEIVDLDGAAPFRVRIGNALQTEVTFRGQKLDLVPATRGNVASLELE